jgi:hypothetical protein
MHGAFWAKIELACQGQPAFARQAERSPMFALMLLAAAVAELELVAQAETDQAQALMLATPVQATSFTTAMTLACMSLDGAAESLLTMCKQILPASLPMIIKIQNAYLQKESTATYMLAAALIIAC